MGIPPRQIPQLPNIARMIATLTWANGGSTWNLVEGDLAGRPFFAVSVFPERSEIVQLNRVYDEPPLDLAVPIEEFIRRNKALLVEDASLSIGTWDHEGKVYLDLSITVSDRETALQLGQRFGQLAIYDLSNGEEIAVPAADEAAA
jgi:hypothetical protein